MSEEEDKKNDMNDIVKRSIYFPRAFSDDFPPRFFFSVISLSVHLYISALLSVCGALATKKGP